MFIPFGSSFDPAAPSAFSPSADTVCCLEGGWHRGVFAVECTETSAAPIVILGVTQTAGGAAHLILLGHTARQRQHMTMKVTSTHYEPGAKIINTHTAQTAREQEQQHIGQWNGSFLFRGERERERVLNRGAPFYQEPSTPTYTH